MNWYSRLIRKIAGTRNGLVKTAMPRRPYKGPPRYFGPMRLISFMGRPAIIGNTMKFDRSVLQQLGFSWQGNTTIDGTQLGDAPDNAINGAMIGSRQLTPEEIEMLTNGGVDTSMSATEFQPYNPNAMQPQPGMEGEVPGQNSANPEGIMPDEGAQSDEENIRMLMDIRSSSGSYQDTKNVVQEQLNKLTEIMANPNLSEEQAKLKEDFIKFMSGAHRYSFWNSLLIFMQNRNASMVGGAKNLWNNKGRQVKEGQDPIWILAPKIVGQQRLSREQYFGMLNKFKEEGMSDDEAKKRIQRYKESTGQLVGFKDVPVYDISQTDPIQGWTDKNGNPPFDHEGFHSSYLNQMNDPEDRADAVWSASTAAMQAAGINVAQEDTGSAGGWSSGGNVRIDESSQGQRRVATLFHEWAHEVLHTSAEGRAKRTKEQTPKHIIEAEAESTAWLLSQAFGLQGDPEHSARYMLLWKATPQEIMERQENIHKAYAKIYNAVQRQLDKMIGDKPEQQATASSHMLRYIGARASLRNRIFAGKDDPVCLLRQLAENLSDGDGLEVFFMEDDPTSVFLSFGDWAENVEEKVAKFEDEGYSILEWDYEVGSPGEGWTRIKGTRIGDNL
jgi:hypothetical protein